MPEPITQTRDMNSGSYRLRKLETAQAVMQEKVNNLEHALKDNTEAVESLTKVMTEARGGWKFLTIQGGLLIGGISLVQFLIDLFKSH